MEKVAKKEKVARKVGERWRGKGRRNRGGQMEKVAREMWPGNKRKRRWLGRRRSWEGEKAKVRDKKVMRKRMVK